MRYSVLLALCLFSIQNVWAGNITAIWANDGGDKVTQDELRATNHTENLTGHVINRTWDGRTIHLYGAQNEVVSFNLVLEAPTSQANNVAVTFDTLTRADGASIRDTVHPTTANNGASFFNWVGRPIELFYVRYLQITGLSYFGGALSAASIPVRFKGPDGTPWVNRQDANKYYPDPLVPLELVPTFNISAAHNQSIWADIYIPKNTPAGIYAGQVIVTEGGATSWSIPVQLSVYPFALPDKPVATTWMAFDLTDITNRYFGASYVNALTPQGQQLYTITDRYYELFHRHKIELVGENECVGLDPNCPAGWVGWQCLPCANMVPRLDGSLFTANNGYDGPGTGQGVTTYAVGGLYGSLVCTGHKWPDEASAWSQLDKWENWFEQNSPQTTRFVYLCDEQADPVQMNTWAQWMHDDPGPGHKILSWWDHDDVAMQTQTPMIQVSNTATKIGTCPVDGGGNQVYDPAGSGTCPNFQSINAAAANYYETTPGHRRWTYNPWRPASGSPMIEEDGIGLREVPWSQYKLGIERYYYWMSNYGNANPFTNPIAFSNGCSSDPSYGHVECDNGGGQIDYPGTDMAPGDDPSNSYGIQGPIASIRMKEWRRGIQDVDYVSLASAMNPGATQVIVSSMVPAAQWEYSYGNVWGGPAISWSPDPDVWESGRAQLAAIIIKGTNSKAEFLGNLNNVRVYPNPWRSDKHAGKNVTFDQLALGSSVKIFTVSGHLVKTLSDIQSNGVQAMIPWDLTNDAGGKVASGIYVYLITDSQGEKNKGKLAVIR